MAMQAKAKKNRSAMMVASRALSMVHSLKADRERKYEITVFEEADVSSGGAVFLLNETSQDVQDVGARIGDSVTCVRIRGSLQLKMPPALNGSHAFRVVLLNDKQNTLANAGQLFIGVGTDHSPMLQYSKDYRLSYGIMMDSMPLNLDNYNPSRVINFDLQTALKTRYLQASTTVVTGALKLVLLTDIGTPAANFLQCTGTVRVDYVDS
jgi:hypothetical protein